MEYNFIKVSKSNGVLRVTLNRPEKRNAFTPTTVCELAYAFNVANEDPEVKVVLLDAEGPVFCSGMDLKVFNDPALDLENPNIPKQDISLGQVFDQLLKPSIAVVQGAVIAGGFLMILGCTYVLAERDCKFRLPELEIGLFPFQVLGSLMKVMPAKKALQLCLHTDYFHVDKALEFGIVDAVMDGGEELDELLNRFSGFDTKVLKAGVQAYKTLPHLSETEYYVFLKSCLEALKSK